MLLHWQSLVLLHLHPLTAADSQPRKAEAGAATEPLLAEAGAAFVYETEPQTSIPEGRPGAAVNQSAHGQHPSEDCLF